MNERIQTKVTNSVVTKGVLDSVLHALVSDILWCKTLTTSDAAQDNQEGTAPISLFASLKSVMPETSLTILFARL